MVNLRDLRKDTSKALNAYRAKEIETLRVAFSHDDKAAERNRKRIAKKQRYSLSKESVTGDSQDLFKRTSRMARTQKLGVDGEKASFGTPYINKQGVHSAKRD